MGLDIVVYGLLLTAIGVGGYRFAYAVAVSDARYTRFGMGLPSRDVEPGRWRILATKGVFGSVALLGLLVTVAGVLTVV